VGRNFESFTQQHQQFFGDCAAKETVSAYTIGIMSWKRSDRLMDTIKVRNVVAQGAQ
jgi:hypothetical protein